MASQIQPVRSSVYAFLFMAAVLAVLRCLSHFCCPIRRKEEKVSASDCGQDWKRGPLRPRHKKASKGISGCPSKPTHKCFFESFPHDFKRPEDGCAAAGSGPVVQSYNVNYAGDSHRWSGVKCTPGMCHPQAYGWCGTWPPWTILLQGLFGQKTFCLPKHCNVCET